MQLIEAIATCEEELRLAMLASDVETLEQMLADDMIFVDQLGIRRSRGDDIAAHRSGLLDLSSLDFRGDRIIRAHGELASVIVTADVAGTYDGAAFFGTFAYLRLWKLQDGRWQITLAQCTASPSSEL
ncbi:nuclear transport factor 2 family protein [Sphingopyxis sp. KK2]|uniref:nuclear transport factor 2 family protein n=1 Tax=Sphingopyxis sp. KK2 TaxID=1855727 RepID=UPI00097E72DA|nr:nuclear transport factor 2 family protein [Sphingopyxis sp. KK2]